MPPTALKLKLVLVDEPFAQPEPHVLPLRSAIGVWLGLSAVIWIGSYGLLALVL